MDYQPDQVADCLPGLVVDYPQAPVVDFPPGQEAAYLRALVAGSLRVLAGECLPAQEAGFPPGQAVVCLQDLAAASQLGPATTGDEFRRNSKVAPTGCATGRTDRAWPMTAAPVTEIVAGLPTASPQS